MCLLICAAKQFLYLSFNNLHTDQINAIWRRESRLVGYGVVIRIGRFPVQTPLGAQPGLGTQPRYKAARDLLVEIVKNAVINMRLVRLPT